MVEAVSLIPRKGIGIESMLVVQTARIVGGRTQCRTTTWRMPIVIEAGPCLLRQWELTDEEAVVRHANDRRVSINLRDRFPYPYTPGDAAQWLAQTVPTEPPLNFAISDRSTGEALGGVGLILREDIERISVEIGFWLGASRWGAGIATPAVRAVTTYAFDALGFERVFAIAFARNHGSVRVLEKLGFRIEGTMLRSAIKEAVVLDQIMYATTRTEWRR